MPGGAPKGNNNAGRGREATKALEKALSELSTGCEGEYTAKFSVLVEAWRKQIKKAVDDGDATAMAMITDRLEGKPRQVMDIGGQEDNPLTVREITRTIVDPKA